MASTSNTLSTILANFIRLQNNSLELMNKVTQATTTNTDVVGVDIKNEDGTTATYLIPSFGFLKQSIDRIDNTLSTLMGFSSDQAYVRMPDGTYKRIFQAKKIVDPKPIGQIRVPDSFLSENNWFFESMLSPSLKVSLDVTEYIPQEESKIYVKRLILNTDTDEKKSFYDVQLKGRNDINYLDLLIDLQKNNINYFVDEDNLDLPLSIVRYSGDFVVVNFEDRDVLLPDGSTTKKRYYLLNSLNYNDNLSLTPNTETLKHGDRITKGETLYEVVEVDNTTNFIRLNRISGYEPLVVGEGIDLYSNTFSPKLANVGIGYDERLIVFFRSINDESNLISTKFSPGIAFYTNDLTISTNNGTKNLRDFYQNNVTDFGSFLLTQAKEKPISAIEGTPPDPPSLDASNFQVVLINDHKLDQKEIDSIKKKASDKVRLQSEILELEKAIDRKKEELNTKKFNSETERRGVKNELDSLIKEKNSRSSLYASIIKELAVLSEQKPSALDKPKYRIRGFFGIPQPKDDPKTGFQNVIQFIVYYRYVRPDGSSSDVKQFTYIDASGAIKRGTYSNLIEVKSDIRKKTYDPVNARYVWMDEDTSNPDVVNINQIDIPIGLGERVEFYVKSVSEAGWPQNPLYSVPSNTITLDFPSNLVTDDEASNALISASKEQVLVQLEEDLASKGLDVHLSSSFNAAEKYYAHSSDVISSSFYTPEGKVISLYEKLKAMETSILEIQNSIAKVKGKLKVFIIDDDLKTKVEVQQGNTINLFAGYYKDYTDLLPSNERRGAIISKVYKLSIQNSEASTLELISRIPGGLAEDLPISLTSTDDDYKNARRYDLAPIVNQSISNDETNNSNKISTAFYQSGQLKSQFLYLRYTDVGLKMGLFQDSPLSPSDRALLPDFTIGTTQTWVWDQTYTSGVPNGNGYLTNFCIHTDHSSLNNGTSTPFSDFQTPLVNIDTLSGFPIAPERVSEFRHSFGFNESIGSNRFSPPQLQYRKNWMGPSSPYPSTYTPLITELPDKYGFINNDRYLIGKNTCGSYLFLGPSTFDQLLVDGTDFRAKKSIGLGDENAIVIPLVYQFRMSDYYGPAGGSGDGIIGGFDVASTTSLKNLTYARKLGIDIYVKDETVFSFDVEVKSIYKKESLAQRVEVIQTSASKVQENLTYNKNTIRSITS